MKKPVTILSAILFLVFNTFAQSPEIMSYQAVIRDSNSSLVKNQSIGMQISILQGSANGTPVYVETQSPTTNANGLVSIEIGTGTTSYDFSAIEWSSGPYFIKTETDPSGGINYSITGTSQLLSVPYALHAKSAEYIEGGINENDPAYSSSPASGIEPSDINNWNEAHTWGDHSKAGYLENYEVTQEDVTSHQEALKIKESQITDLKEYYLSTNPDSFITDYEATQEDVTSHQEALKIKESQISDLKDYATKDMNNERITNLADPVNDNDAATKAYVDALLERIEALEEANVEMGFTDPRDGNYYKTVKIGNQEWMAENLKYLPSVVGENTRSETTPYYYVYGYNGTNVAEAKATSYYNTYGALYNWTAAMNNATNSYDNPSGVQGVCPAGWHLPSPNEYSELAGYLSENGYNFDGSIEYDEFDNKIAKSLASLSSWKFSSAIGSIGNEEYTEYRNKSGFSALPGGYCYYDFNHIGMYALFWLTYCHDIDGEKFASTMFFEYYDESISAASFPSHVGGSVRCVKD